MILHVLCAPQSHRLDLKKKKNIDVFCCEIQANVISAELLLILRVRKNVSLFPAGNKHTWWETDKQNIKRLPEMLHFDHIKLWQTFTLFEGTKLQGVNYHVGAIINITTISHRCLEYLKMKLQCSTLDMFQQIHLSLVQVLDIIYYLFCKCMIFMCFSLLHEMINDVMFCCNYCLCVLFVVIHSLLSTYIKLNKMYILT